MPSIKRKRHYLSSGFSLIELMFSVGIMSFISLGLAFLFIQEKTQEVATANRIELSMELQNVAHKLNSTDSARRLFDQFKLAMSTANQVSFDKCVQKHNGTNCAIFDVASYPPIVSVPEVTPISHSLSLKTEWQASAQCTASYCSSFKVQATVSLIGANAVPLDISSKEYLAMKHQIAQMASTPSREFPMASLTKKAVLNYGCAGSATSAPVTGLDVNNEVAVCKPNVGKSTCAGTLGDTPLVAFGGESDQCEALVSVGCASGISNGGFFSGACASPTPPTLTTVAHTDSNTGKVDSVVVCGGGSGSCILLDLAAYYRPGAVWAGAAGDIIEQIKNSPTYNQMIATWQNEGVLLTSGVMGLTPSGSGFDGNVLGTNGAATSVDLSVVPQGSVSTVGYSTVTIGVTTNGSKNVDPAIFR